MHNGSPLSPDPAHDHSPPSVSSAPPPPHTLATPIPVPHSTLTSTRPAEPRPLASAISFPSVSSPGIHYATPTLSHDQMGAGSLVSAVSVPLPSIVTNSSPGVRFAATPTSARDRRGAGLMSQFSENVVVSRSLSSSVTAAVVSNSAAIPSTAAGPVGATTTGITGMVDLLRRTLLGCIPIDVVSILTNLKYFFAGQNPTFCRTFLVFAGHPRSFQNIPQILLALHLKHTEFYHFISKCKTQILQDT